MPRPREQSDDEILDKAVEVFWERGFAATSVRDISNACDLGVAALYNRFNNKDQLFIAALNRFADRTPSGILARLADVRPPVRAISAFFDAIVDMALNDPGCRGCLLVNTALEGAALPELANEVVRSRLGEIEAFFAKKLREARAEGAIPKTIQPDTLAESLFGTVLAIRVIARIDPDPQKLRRLARSALAPVDSSHKTRLQ